MPYKANKTTQTIRHWVVFWRFMNISIVTARKSTPLITNFIFAISGTLYQSRKPNRKLKFLFFHREIEFRDWWHPFSDANSDFAICGMDSQHFPFFLLMWQSVCFHSLAFYSWMFSLCENIPYTNTMMMKISLRFSTIHERMATA